MPYYSPLRYPGGKKRLYPFAVSLLETNGLHPTHYVEPFAGGSSLALALLFGGHVDTIHINDLSRPIYAFWHSVLNDTERLCRKVELVSVTMTEWYTQRRIYETEDAELDALGFATFFLNRTNRSGILNGGVIGGKAQSGDWKLGERFNKNDLISRIRRIAERRGEIAIYNQEGIEFIEAEVKVLTGDTFVMCDPPYIQRGQDLYLNKYTPDDHRRLESAVTSLDQPWFVTYDYEGAVEHGLYSEYTRVAFGLAYTTQARLMGREALFLSEGLRLPSASESFTMSGAHNTHPVVGVVEAAAKK